MIPFLFPFSRGLLFPLVALDKITTDLSLLDLIKTQKMLKSWLKRLCPMDVVPNNKNQAE